MITAGQKEQMLGLMLKLSDQHTDVREQAADELRELLDVIHPRRPTYAQEKARARIERTIWIDKVMGGGYVAIDHNGVHVPDTVYPQQSNTENAARGMICPGGYLEHVHAIAIMTEPVKRQPDRALPGHALQPAARPKRRMRPGNNEGS